MGVSWEHPSLGQFEHDSDRHAWTTTINLPAFEAFTYCFASAERIGRCELWLCLEANDETDLPSSATVALVSKLAANQEKLVRSIAVALWDDFNGRGPDSEMWWHDHLEEVEDAYDSRLPPLDSSDAVLAWMRPTGIIVRNSGIRAIQPPVVEMTFDAPFEVEHNVGVLTDGLGVIGTGYALEVEPFEST